MKNTKAQEREREEEEEEEEGMPVMCLHDHPTLYSEDRFQS